MPANLLIKTGHTSSSDMSEEELVVAINEIILSAAEQESKRIFEFWAAVETKAQFCVTLAGVYVGAYATFLRDAPLPMDYIGQALTAATVALLVLSVGYSTSALALIRLPTVASATDLLVISADARRHMTAGGEAGALLRFNEERILMQSHVNDQTSKKLAQKADHLRIAQAFILFAIIASSLELVLRLLA
jgi:hypothetical protein